MTKIIEDVSQPVVTRDNITPQLATQSMMAISIQGSITLRATLTLSNWDTEPPLIIHSQIKSSHEGRNSLAKMALAMDLTNQGNGPDQDEVHPTLKVCQDGRFGRGQADGKVGCQPRECEVSLLTTVTERLNS